MYGILTQLIKTISLALMSFYVIDDIEMIKHESGILQTKYFVDIQTLIR